MKSEGQIKQKVKQVIFRHRKAYMKRGLSKRPENCIHNHRVTLPVHMANRASLGVCGYCGEDGPNNVVCDSTMGGDKQAAECPYFQERSSAEDLKEEFNRKLGLDGEKPVEIGYIAKEYPDVAALLWVMGPGKTVNREVPPPESKSNILAFFGDEDEPDHVPERPLVEEEEEDDGG